MKREFKLITSGREEYSQITKIVTIEDDSITVYDAIQDALEENDVIHPDIYTVKNMNDETLFTEEDVDEYEENGDTFFCRWCGIKIPSEQGVYVEDGSSECHCEDCHPILYPNEEVWDELYNEYNIDKDSGEECNNFGGEYYYWTTAP